MRATDKLVVKGIYSEAFKEATQWARYATSPGLRDLPNPNLGPERVRNFELGLNWQVMERIRVQAAAWRAVYRDGVAIQRVPFGNTTTLQNQAIGNLLISGAQAHLTAGLGSASLYANYTYTRGESKQGDEVVRISDIAPHRANLGISAPYKEHLRFSLRGNWSDPRPVGVGTTMPDNDLTQIDGFLVFNGSLTYTPMRLGVNAQLLVNNLFDETYQHGGVFHRCES